MYKYRNTNYQKKLIEQENKIFSTSDLAVLWEIENENTLWTTIQRYLKREILYSIQRGLYATIPLNGLNLFELGCAVAGAFSYVSAETVLQQEGVIVQNLDKITLFGSKHKEFEVANQKYWCRYLNPKYLLNRGGIVEKKTYSMANLNRAVVDLLQVSPGYYFDNQLTLNQKKIIQLKRKVGYK